jgi:hypothetical protein
MSLCETFGFDRASLSFLLPTPDGRPLATQFASIVEELGAGRLY